MNQMNTQECNYCHKLYSTISSLNNHIKTSKSCKKIRGDIPIDFEYKVFPCDDCKKEYASKYSLETHNCKGKEMVVTNIVINNKFSPTKNENLDVENVDITVNTIVVDETPHKASRKQRIPKALKTKVWEKCIGNVLIGSCYACNREIRFDAFEAGHIISEANGGEVHLDNLKPICKPCNGSCYTKNLDDFRKSMISKLSR
jgi:hypothetical protein